MIVSIVAALLAGNTIRRKEESLEYLLSRAVLKNCNKDHPDTENHGTGDDTDSIPLIKYLLKTSTCPAGAVGSARHRAGGSGTAGASIGCHVARWNATGNMFVATIINLVPIPEQSESARTLENEAPNGKPIVSYSRC